MRKRFGYSVHVIHENGTPVPVAFKRRQRQAIDLARETEQATNCEVRVWNVRNAQCVYPKEAR